MLITMRMTLALSSRVYVCSKSYLIRFSATVLRWHKRINISVINTICTCDDWRHMAITSTRVKHVSILGRVDFQSTNLGAIRIHRCSNADYLCLPPRRSNGCDVIGVADMGSFDLRGGTVPATVY